MSRAARENVQNLYVLPRWTPSGWYSSQETPQSSGRQLKIDSVIFDLAKRTGSKRLESKRQCALVLKGFQGLNRRRSIKERRGRLTDAHRLGSADALGAVDALGSAVRMEELRQTDRERGAAAAQRRRMNVRGGSASPTSDQGGPQGGRRARAGARAFVSVLSPLSFDSVFS